MASTISYFKKDRKKHLVDKNLRTIADCIKLHAETIPDHEAVVFVSSDRKRTAVTFITLFDNALTAAKRLLNLGVKRAEHVALPMRTCPEWLYAFFRSMFAGAVPVSLSFTFTDGSDVIAFMEKIRTCSTMVLDPGVEDGNWKIFRQIINKFDKTGNVQSDKMPYLRYLICHNGTKDHESVLTLNDMMTWNIVHAELSQIDPDYT